MALHLAGALSDLLDYRVNGEVDAALEIHRVHARGHRLHAFAEDPLGEHGRGRGAVTGNIAGLRGDLTDHLCAHVFKLVRKLNLLSDGNTILGDARCPESLVEDHIAALRPERDPDRIG